MNTNASIPPQHSTGYSTFHPSTDGKSLNYEKVSSPNNPPIPSKNDDVRSTESVSLNVLMEEIQSLASSLPNEGDRLRGVIMYHPFSESVSKLLKCSSLELSDQPIESLSRLLELIKTTLLNRIVGGNGHGKSGQSPPSSILQHQIESLCGLGKGELMSLSMGLADIITRMNSGISSVGVSHSSGQGSSVGMSCQQDMDMSVRGVSIGSSVGQSSYGNLGHLSSRSGRYNREISIGSSRDLGSALSHLSGLCQPLSPLSIGGGSSIYNDPFASGLGMHSSASAHLASGHTHRSALMSSQCDDMDHQQMLNLSLNLDLGDYRSDMSGRADNLREAAQRRFSHPGRMMSTNGVDDKTMSDGNGDVQELNLSQHNHNHHHQPIADGIRLPTAFNNDPLDPSMNLNSVRDGEDRPDMGGDYSSNWVSHNSLLDEHSTPLFFNDYTPYSSMGMGIDDDMNRGCQSLRHLERVERFEGMVEHESRHFAPNSSSGGGPMTIDYIGNPHHNQRHHHHHHQMAMDSMGSRGPSGMGYPYQMSQMPPMSQFRGFRDVGELNYNPNIPFPPHHYYSQYPPSDPQMSQKEPHTEPTSVGGGERLERRHNVKEQQLGHSSVTVPPVAPKTTSLDTNAPIFHPQSPLQRPSETQNVPKRRPKNVPNQTYSPNVPNPNVPNSSSNVPVGSGKRNNNRSQNRERGRQKALTHIDQMEAKLAKLADEVSLSGGGRNVVRGGGQVSQGQGQGQTVAESNKRRRKRTSSNRRSETKWTVRYEIQIDHFAFKPTSRILGESGANMKMINGSTNCKLRVRGRGSNHFEGPSMREANEPLHLCISSVDEVQFRKAIQMADGLLQSIYDEYAEWSEEHIGNRIELVLKREEAVIVK